MLNTENAGLFAPISPIMLTVNAHAGNSLSSNKATSFR